MRDKWLLILLAATLLLAMLFTLMTGGERSRHGYGSTPPCERRHGGPCSIG